jgi:hypothetical protein
MQNIQQIEIEDICLPN